MYITPFELDVADALDYMHKSSENFVKNKKDGSIYWINDLGKICKFNGFTDLTGELKGEIINHKDFPLDVFEVARRPSHLNNPNSNITPPPIPKEVCDHSWKEVILFSSISHDCVKCGARKEDTQHGN